MMSSTYRCKYSTCTCGGHDSLQLVLVVFSFQPLAQIPPLHLCNLQCVLVVMSENIAIVLVGTVFWEYFGSNFACSRPLMFISIAPKTV